MVFFDLVEKNNYWWNTTYRPVLSNMDAERRDVERQIEQTLSKYYTVLPISDTCLRRFQLDSISRRDNKAIYELQASRGWNKKLIVIDATWIVLDGQSIRAQWLRASTGRESRLGTWFTIRSSIYNGTKRDKLFFNETTYAQERITLPIKHFLRIGHIVGASGHRRFFRRSIENVRDSLSAD